MTDLTIFGDQKTYIRGRKAAIKGCGERYGSEKQIPPLAEVILMHFAVAFPVSRGSDDDSVFSAINLVVAGERGGSAILARRFSLRLVRAKDRVLHRATRFPP
jgi:hypothetical protein